MLTWDVLLVPNDVVVVGNKLDFLPGTVKKTGMNGFVINLAVFIKSMVLLTKHL